ncbi:MAG: TolC family protein [Bacillota bacterium]
MYKAEKTKNKSTIRSIITKKWFWVVFAAVITTSQIMPQSLDSLISEAVRNNPRLKSLEYKTKSAEYRAESVNSLPAPTLGIEFGEIPFGKYNIINDAYSNSISLSQMFMLGGKIGAMTEVEKKNALVQTDNYASYRVNLTGQIKMSYYNLWMVERKIEIQKSTIELYKDLINNINVLYSINRINQADVLTIRTEIASSETQLLNLQREREAEVYKLNKLLGRELSSNTVYAEKEIKFDSLSYTQAELEEKLVEANPSLRQMNSMVEMNKAMLKANEKDRIPDLMVQAMVMRQPQGMPLTTKSDISMLAMGMPGEPMSDYMYSIMASITLPFAPWSSNKYSAREEEIAAGIRGIEYEKSDMQREMAAGIRQAFSKLKSSEDLIKLYSGRVIPLYEEATRSQVSAYQNGRTSISTVIDSYRMQLMQKMNYYMAQADYQMAAAEIEMMIGKELKKGE